MYVSMFPSLDKDVIKRVWEEVVWRPVDGRASRAREHMQLGQHKSGSDPAVIPS